MDPWILDSDIKVIHLIRDPRAVYASMAQKPKTWKGSLENVDGMCKRMLGDVLLGSKLPSDRWDKIGQGQVGYEVFNLGVKID